jgi:DNA helicase-2/ATP-dependent DNA helicase PcrA
VITERYRHLLENGISPNAIVVVTFTHAMAGELRERLGHLVPALRNREHRPAWDQIGTIHSVCWRMLRQSGLPRGKVAGPAQIRHILRDLIHQHRPEHGPFFTTEHVWSLVRLAKGHGVGEGDAGQFYSTHTDPKVAECLAKIYAGYNRQMREKRLITFDDMVGDVEIRLREDPGFCQKWQACVQYVFLDEAQDTSAQAMRVLARLAAPQNRMMIVGDGDQMLFRFSGAAPEHNLYQGFEQFFPTSRTYLLNVNYRSHARIVECARRLIRHNYEAYGGSSPDRFRKALVARPGAPAGPPVTFQLHGTVEAEAAWAAAQIARMLKRGRQPDDVFVGARTRAQLTLLEHELERRHIPHVNLNNQSFWLRSHIRDLLDHAALALDRGDQAAFKRIYNIPSNQLSSRRLGRKFLEACGRRWAGMAQALKSSEGRRWRLGVADLETLMHKIAAHAETHRPREVVEFVLAQGYRQHLARLSGMDVDLAGDDTLEEKMNEIRTLLQVADRFDTCTALVQHARQQQKEAARAEEKGHVVLATIHKLKGKERPVVFGLGWCEDALTGRGEPVGYLPHTYSLRSEDTQALEDERCLAYVLVTRVKEACHLSGVCEHPLTGAEMRPSRFIAEMGLAEGQAQVANLARAS